MKKKITKKKVVRGVNLARKDWRDFPKKTFEEWFAEFVISQLAVEFYGQTKKWPTKMNLASLKVIEQRDGSATLTIDLQ